MSGGSGAGMSVSPAMGGSSVGLAGSSVGFGGAESGISIGVGVAEVGISPVMDVGLDIPGGRIGGSSIVEQAEHVLADYQSRVDGIVSDKPMISLQQAQLQALVINNYALQHGISFSSSSATVEKQQAVAPVREFVMPQTKVTQSPETSVATESTLEPSSTVISAAKAVDAAQALGLGHLVTEVQTLAEKQLAVESERNPSVGLEAMVTGLVSPQQDTSPETTTGSEPEQNVTTVVQTADAKADTKSKTGLGSGISSSVKSLPKGEEERVPVLPALEEEKDDGDPEQNFGPVKDERANSKRRDIAGNVGKDLAAKAAETGEKISGDEAAVIFEKKVNDSALSAILAGKGPDGTAKLAGNAAKGKVFDTADQVRVALIDGVNAHTAVAPGLRRQVSVQEEADVFDGRRFAFGNAT